MFSYEDCCFCVDDVPPVILERHGVKTYLPTILLFEHLLEDSEEGYYVGYSEDDFPPGLLEELEEKGIIDLVDQTDVDNGVFIRIKKEIHIERLILMAEVEETEITNLGDYEAQLDRDYAEHDL